MGISKSNNSHHDALNASAIGNRVRPEPEPDQQDDSSPNDQRAYAITQFLLKMMQKDSPFFQNNPSTKLPQFESGEVTLDQNIGQGEFGVVFSIKSIRAPKDEAPIVIAEEDETTTHDETDIAEDDHHEGPEHQVVGGAQPTPSTVKVYFDNCSDISLDDAPLDAKGIALLLEPDVNKRYMSDHAIRDGMPRYAIKRLRKDLKGNVLVQATADLAAEANFLRSLRHPNICRMRGTIGEPGKKGFAIVLDRLTMTLRKKMSEWKKLDGLSNGNVLLSKVKSAFWSQNKKADHLVMQSRIHGEKQMAIYDIARALRHLAEHGVIYRDLKPENVGIDLRGDLRLFDFGLAKELKEKDLVGDGLYKLTGMTGSRRYMAPEVITSKPYGLSADVYGYAILVWEVLSDRQAYGYASLEKHFEMVVQRKKRPSLKKLVPNQKVLPPDSKLAELVKNCWAHKPGERPSIETVCEILFGEIQSYSRKSRSAVDRSAHLLASSLQSRLNEPLWC